MISSSPKEVQEGYYQYNKGTYSIGSGLIVSRDLKKTLIDAFGEVFDHHFAFMVSIFHYLEDWINCNVLTNLLLIHEQNFLII